MREWSARVTAGALPQAATKTVAPTIEAICVHIFIVWIPHTRKIWEGSSDSYKVRIRRLQRSCQRRMAYLRRAKWPVLQAFVHVCTRGVQSNGVTRLRSRGMRACAWACDGVPRRMRRQGGRLHARGADCRRGAPCSRKVSNRPDKVGGLRRCRDGAAAVARFHYRDFHRIGHAEAASVPGAEPLVPLSLEMASLRLPASWRATCTWHDSSALKGSSGQSALQTRPGQQP